MSRPWKILCAAFAVAVTAAPAPQAQSGHYVHYPNRAIGGANLRLLTGVTLEQCLADCDRDPQCQSVEHLPQFYECRPQDRATGMVEANGYDIWVKAPATGDGSETRQGSWRPLPPENPYRQLPPPSGPGSAGNYIHYPGKAISGYNLNSRSGVPLEDCFLECDQRADCLAVEYHPATRQCQPQSRADGMVNEPNYDIWVKRPGGGGRVTTGPGQPARPDPNQRFYYYPPPDAPYRQLQPPSGLGSAGNYIHYPGKAISGYNLNSRSGVPLEDCFLECDQRADCLAVEYHPATRQCQPQSRADGMVNEPNYDIWVKRIGGAAQPPAGDPNQRFYYPPDTPAPQLPPPSALPPLPGAGNYVHYPGKAISGYNLSSRSGVPLEDCFLECDQRADCLAVEYHPATRQCQPQSRADGMIDEPNYDIWVKVANGGARGAGARADSDMSGWRVDYGPYDAGRNQIDARPAGDGKTSYYLPPAAMLGDWTAYRALVFEKKSWGGSYYGPDAYGATGDVVLKNGSMTARYDLPQDHSGDWRRYRIPLSEAGWRLSGGARQLSDVLRNVTELRIRAEYGAGTDYSSLRAAYFER